MNNVPALGFKHFGARQQLHDMERSDVGKATGWEGLHDVVLSGRMAASQ
jgi:hypothetical protein